MAEAESRVHSNIFYCIIFVAGKENLPYFRLASSKGWAAASLALLEGEAGRNFFFCIKLCVCTYYKYL